MNEVNNMNREELEATASDLGLSFPHNISDDKLRTKINESLGDALASADATAEATDITNKSVTEKRFEIIITRHDQDKQPVPVGINGKTYLIQRGQKVIVPRPVVIALENAVQHHYDPDTMERSDVQSYPFQIVREV